MKRRSVSAARPGQAAPDISLERNRTVLVAIERPVIWEDSATIRCNSQTILSERKSLQNWGTKGRIVSIRLHRQDIGIHAFTVTAEGTL